MWRKALLGVLALVVAGVAWLLLQPDPPTRLRAAFPVLERYQVRFFRDQSWCRCFLYARGGFMASSHPSTCKLFAGPARPYDAQADKDFQAVRRALSGSRVMWLEADYAGGRLQRAEFEVATLTRMSYLRYVYEPGYTLPADMGSEMRFEPIDPDWYRCEEEWL